MIVAHVLAACIAQRLKVPRRISSDSQRVIDEMTAPLARDDVGMQGGYVPSVRYLLEQFSHTRGMSRHRDKIPQFVRIVLQIVELIGIDRGMHEFVGATLDHHHGGDRSLGKILADDLILAGASRELRDETVAVQRRCEARGIRAGEIAKGGQNVDQRRGAGHAPRSEPPRRMHDQGNPAGRLEEAHFVPKSALAQHVAVIGEQQHHGVVGKACTGKRRQQHADLIVDIRNRSVVRTPCSTDLRLVHGLQIEATDMAQPPGVRIEFIGGHVHSRHVDLNPGIAVPIGLRNHVRVVRMSQGCDQAERAPILGPGHVEELLTRVEDHVVIEVDLIGARARARLGDGIHGVIPSRPMLEAIPVGRPAEIGRVDVGGQPFFESMQLIRAAKVHLAAQRGLVPGAPQIMRKGGHLRGKFGRIVVCADGRHLAARQKRKSRRGAKRTIAIERIEDHTGGGQRVDVRRLGDFVSVSGKRTRGQLIRHQNEKVRAVRQGILRQAMFGIRA